MTRETILKKAIEKAVKNGLDISKYNFWFRTDNGNLMTEQITKRNVFNFIFSHDFAKAFWGDKIIKITICDSIGITHQMVWNEYLYHLQQMVIEKDRIKYLEKSL